MKGEDKWMSAYTGCVAGTNSKSCMRGRDDVFTQFQPFESLHDGELSASSDHARLSTKLTHVISLANFGTMQLSVSVRAGTTRYIVLSRVLLHSFEVVIQTQLLAHPNNQVMKVALALW